MNGQITAVGAQDFLKPFEYIMNHSKRVDVRDMVVTCLAQMVQSHVWAETEHE